MSNLVAIAGLGDDAPAQPSGRTMLVWGLIVGTTVGIFVGTLMLNPNPRRRSRSK